MHLTWPDSYAWMTTQERWQTVALLFASYFGLPIAAMLLIIYGG